MVRPIESSTRAKASELTPRRGTSLLACIGGTPLLRIERVLSGVKEGVEILAKAEWFNPGGSVKDRPVLRMIEEAERSGQLTPEKVILDSTSGNAGIAYAMIGAIKGYQVELVVPGNVSEERRKIIAAYGARIIVSDPLEGSDGAIRVARRIYEENPDRYFMPDQYNNPENWRAHYHTTGVEILEQTGGRVTHFVAGIGTSGTLMGVGRRLKEFNPAIEVIAVEPDSPLHGIEGLKHMETAIVPGIYDPRVHDRKIHVRTEDAYAMARRLAREEGLFVGQSAGAAMVAALEVARSLEEGVVVVIFPDGGDRYLSTALWREL
ncbi:MAG: cysteine synthase family protein [Armatimonadota bacterium]|nr:cysteine synthase family protein [Armatimonadota bacterium]MDR5703334.1 cysteine synthase family protein [Armatimonadota bacterium]MDR7433516.1 cysteine synthase family protein [Armatimonadota bacterium]